MPSRILYIEDNLDNLVLVRRILQAEGFEVLEAMTATEGIEIAERYLPDLILVDINMPKMDGLTATGYMRQNPKLQHTQIIALTANVMKGAREATLEAGCDGYIAKPIDVDRFVEQIVAFLKT